ncbi:MAG: SGNH/GDSL hydrolase family protein [Ferruginibacter sp.]
MLKKITGKANRNAYGHFFIQLASVLLIIWIVDFTAGALLRHFYFKQKTGWDYNTLYSIEKADADVLIFGSSKGVRQYHPEVFEKRLNMSYYNTSREGFFMLYYEAVLRCVLKRHTPKLVVLDIRTNEFLDSKQNYDKLSVLLPFYRDHPEIRPILDLRGKYERLKLISSIYPFNSLLFKIAANNGFKKEEREVIKGYERYDEIWKKPIKPAKNYETYTLDSNFVRSYENFIDACKEKNINLVIVTTPYLNMLDRVSPTVTLAKEIAQKKQVMFIDYSHEPSLVNRRELFFDPIHLNNEGAKIMSNMIIDSLEKH